MKTYEITGPFDESSQCKCLAWVKSLPTPAELKDPVKLTIDSQGGVVAPVTLELLRALLAIRTKGLLITHTSFASSVAGLIFLLGNKRILSSDGFVFLHGVQVSFPVWAIPEGGNMPHDDQAYAWSLQKLAEGIVHDTTGMQLKLVERFMRTKKGKTFKAAEALREKIATEIELAHRQQQMPLGA